MYLGKTDIKSRKWPSCLNKMDSVKMSRRKRVTWLVLSAHQVRGGQARGGWWDNYQPGGIQAFCKTRYNILYKGFQNYLISLNLIRWRCNQTLFHKRQFKMIFLPPHILVQLAGWQDIVIVTVLHILSGLGKGYVIFTIKGVSKKTLYYIMDWGIPGQSAIFTLANWNIHKFGLFHFF